MNLDARLRRALQPVDPPAGFARRVRQRIEADGHGARAHEAVAGGGWRSWLATAAAVAAIAAGTYAYQEYEQRREALAARAQILLGLQIASRELNAVQRVVAPPRHESEASATTDAGEDQ
jgi:hypothetical protein